jgi:hypothetical protein
VRFSLRVQPEPQFLLVEAEGPMDLGDLCGMFDLASRICASNRHRRLLLNLLGVEVDLPFTQHLTLGAHAASSLATLDRVASVVSVAARRGTSEKAAQKHGLRFQTFTDLAQGLAWISEREETLASPHG